MLFSLVMIKDVCNMGSNLFNFQVRKFINLCITFMMLIPIQTVVSRKTTDAQLHTLLSADSTVSVTGIGICK